MLDSAPDEKSKRELQLDLGATASPPSLEHSAAEHSAAEHSAAGDSGLTDFVVRDPASAELSTEELQRTVVSLIRERDYLRKSRDVQQAENASELAEHRAQADYLSRERDELVEDRDVWRDRANRAEARLARTLSGRVKRWLLRLRS